MQYWKYWIDIRFIGNRNIILKIRKETAYEYESMREQLYLMY